MDFISNQDSQIKDMLAAIGIDSIEKLFSSVPSILKIPKPTEDDGLSEYEGMKWMEKIASRNTFPSYDNYLGAGSYEHHVPAIVGAICSKSEFLTSYTPYQAEASQGMLQAIFEFQSAICALTGLDAANASVYDGASACGEAVLMALRHQKEKTKILVAGSLNPHYRGVVDQYAGSHASQIETIPFLPDGRLDIEYFKKHLDDTTAAVLVQSPNFFGIIENVRAIADQAKRVGALTIVCANPLAYGMFASAGELGADIAVGDCQPFGLSMHFGGPYAGYMACRQDLVRQLPGRIAGETVDAKGGRGFVLTLQAREQHIRREKASSNICTNQALAALATWVAILWLGPKGIKDLALMNYQKAAYLRHQLESVKGIKCIGNSHHFNEFMIRFDRPLHEVITYFRSQGIEPGVDLGRYFPSLKDSLLVAVTETKSLEQLDRYIEVCRTLK